MTQSSIILTIPSLPDDIILNYRDDDNKKIWISDVPKLSLTKEDNSNNVKILDKGKELTSLSDNLLISLFLDRWIDAQKEQLYTQMAGFEDTESSFVKKPNFDPEQIRVDPKTFSVPDIERFIQKKDLDIKPDFQRHFVWEKKRQSRLIESLMLRIPLPVFYLSQDKEGEFQIVDGLQRLTTIHNFVNNRLVLKELEYLHDCEGKTFDTLEPKYRRRIEYAQLNFHVIDPSTPANVKFELFKRINQGGKALNSQEIRNSMAKSEVRNLLKMTESEAFQTATNGSVKDLRMDDQELAMRFIAFYLWKFHKVVVENIKISKKEKDTKFDYRGDMEVFLDEVLDILNNKSLYKLFPQIKQDFENAMLNAQHLFGEYAFRKCKKEHLEPNAKKQLINKSLFTVWSVVLSQYDSEQIKQKNQFGCLNSPLAEMLEKEAKYFTEILETNEPVKFNYFDSVTTGTNQVNKIELGFKVAEKLIQTHIKI